MNEEAFHQRAVDKAHGALGMAYRVVESHGEEVQRLLAKLDNLRAQEERTVTAIAKAKAGLAEAQAELSVREADPLLSFPSSKGEVHLTGAEPATGTGGVN